MVGAKNQYCWCKNRVQLLVQKPSAIVGTKTQYNDWCKKPVLLVQKPNAMVGVKACAVHWFFAPTIALILILAEMDDSVGAHKNPLKCYLFLYKAKQQKSSPGLGNC